MIGLSEFSYIGKFVCAWWISAEVWLGVKVTEERSNAIAASRADIAMYSRVEV